MHKWFITGFWGILLIAAAGCSKQDLVSRIQMFRAEDQVAKAAGLKDKKVAYDLRLPFYAKACTLFKSSFDADPNIFTLNRIEQAADVCWRAGNRENEEVFKNFEEQYAKLHPQEYEHGDSGVAMIDGGG